MTLKKVPNEEWAKITFKRPTKKKDYFISNFGRSKSIDKESEEEKELKTHPDHRGFFRASIKVQGNLNQAIYVHKEVAKHFVEPESDEHIYVIHKDLNRKNNTISNIIWVDEIDWKKYVKARAVKFGFKKSTKGGYFKLTAAQVAIIKKQLIIGKTRRKMIAKRFGVSTTQLKRIERGENWGHVEPAK
ncbi:MAG: NUMOD4 domain-containing protein [Saprospiraceae bacterium]